MSREEHNLLAATAGISYVCKVNQLGLNVFFLRSSSVTRIKTLPSGVLWAAASLPEHQEQAAEARWHCRQQATASLPGSTASTTACTHSMFLPAELKHTTGPFLNYLASKLVMLLILLLSPCTYSTSFVSSLSTVASEDWKAVAVQAQLCQHNHSVHSSSLLT